SGVEFQFETGVEHINVNGNRASGVTLSGGRTLTADAIVANADLPYVYSDLLPANGRAEKLAHKQYSCSVVSFFWGVDKLYPGVGPHTLSLVDDYRENFDSIDRLQLPEHPSLYIHAPARLDLSMAPPNQDTMIAIVPVGHLDDSGKQNWDQLRENARNAV